MNWGLKKRDLDVEESEREGWGKWGEGMGEVKGEGSGSGIELACPPSEGCKEPLFFIKLQIGH
jgi:hypothetical protein